MKTSKNFFTWFSEHKLIGKLDIGCAGLFMFLCLCAIPIVVFSPATPTPKAVDVSGVQTMAIKTAMFGINQTEAANATTGATKLANTPTPFYTLIPTYTQTIFKEIGMIGERRESGGIALTVLAVSKADSISYSTPEYGNIFLIIEVVIENISRDEAPYNPLYFSVKDGDGFESNRAWSSPEPSLLSGTLLKGDKVRGFVAFEVRSTASGFVVTYEPIVFLGGYEPIRINLGQ